MARENNRDYGKRIAELALKQKRTHPPHSCEENIEYVEFDGSLGQAYLCSVCGTLLQVG